MYMYMCVYIYIYIYHYIPNSGDGATLVGVEHADDADEASLRLAGHARLLPLSYIVMLIISYSSYTCIFH